MGSLPTLKDHNCPRIDLIPIFINLFLDESTSKCSTMTAQTIPVQVFLWLCYSTIPIMNHKKCSCGIASLLVEKNYPQMGRVANTAFWFGLIFFSRLGGLQKERKTKLSMNHNKNKFCLPGEKSHSQSRMLLGWVGKLAGRERLCAPKNRFRPSRFCSASLMLGCISSACQISELGQSPVLYSMYIFWKNPETLEPSVLRMNIKISHWTSI